MMVANSAVPVMPTMAAIRCLRRRWKIPAVTMKTRVDFFKKYMARAKALAQQENALKKRLSTIGASVEDRGVLDAIGEVDATFKDATALLQEIHKFGATSKQQITAAINQIKAEGARAT